MLFEYSSTTATNPLSSNMGTNLGIEYRFYDESQYYPPLPHEYDEFSTIYLEIHISSELKELLKQGIIDEQIVDLGMQIIKVMSRYIGGKISSVILSAYNPVEEEFEDWVPYLEIKVKVDSAEELLKLWDDIMEILKEHFSQEDLEKIGVFLTR